MLPKSWKKSFNSGVDIPAKMRFCNECNGNIICNRCKNQMNESKDFEANLNLLKRQGPNDFGHMFLCFKEQDDLFAIVHILYILF